VQGFSTGSRVAPRVFNDAMIEGISFQARRLQSSNLTDALAAGGMRAVNAVDGVEREWG
jgi:trimethylamine:corrinoid methyltransferase-like protein